MFQILLFHGADLSIVDNENNTPLDIGIEQIQEAYANFEKWKATEIKNRQEAENKRRREEEQRRKEAAIQKRKKKRAWWFRIITFAIFGTGILSFLIYFWRSRKLLKSTN